MLSNHRSIAKSVALYAEAKKVIPGGVNSPVRAFGSVGGSPLFMKRASGAYMWDEDGNKYIDYINSWGPTILGHAHPEVVKAICDVAADGLTFGTPTARETELAQKLISALPGMDMVRLVSSGTEACMSALRVARGFTKRTKIIKFDGCYHGHADMLLVKAGSGVATLGISGSPGVPEDAAQHTLTVQFNDLNAVESLFKSCKNEIAAVILEPIVGNAGFIRPGKGFLKGLRDLCTAHGAVLIFDEVMTGFRTAWGGVQVIEAIRPDMTVLGKVVGGGLPLAAYGGRREIMEMVAPAGPVYQAGTLSGNPLATTAGLKTLEILGRPGVFAGIAAKTSRLISGLTELAAAARIPFQADCEGGMFGLFFAKEPVKSFADAKGCDTQLFGRFFRGMLERGVYLAPSAFEAGFVSLAHTDADIDATLAAAEAEFAGFKK